MRVTAIIPAAGSGSRTGLNYNKILLTIGAETVLSMTLRPFILSPIVTKIVIAANKSDISTINNIVSRLSADKPIIVIEGGKNRTESVKNSLIEAEDSDIILIHDGARPFVTNKLITDVAEAAENYGGATAAVPVTDTLKRVKNEIAVETPDRSEFYAAQTPQGFKTTELLRAYEAADDESFTDDTALYERYIGAVRIVEGDPKNVKITTENDLTRFFPLGYRVGVGYDVHPLVEGRKLIIGGVEIPHHKGLYGHSDADVLTHAIMDALLTAAGKRDIGILFPDNDNQYLNANSLHLLREVYIIISKEGFKVSNVSVEIIAEKPRLASYIPIMQANIAKVLEIESDKVSIAATTSEGLGITGGEQAMAAHAVAAIAKR
jgi:2-C-methyl-D-erythritol 4-phosphate cytidylyltransferase/2-C-methyl-D-erythritol 2,4-cyclodiphosphate synthase